MERTDLQRLSKDELIELVLRLQRPDKTSRTSSKPPSTDKRETRELRPAGRSPGMSRIIVDWPTIPNEFRDHRPTHCELCGGSVSPDADMELIGEYDEIEMPPVKPHMGIFGSRGQIKLRIDNSSGCFGIQSLSPLTRPGRSRTRSTSHSVAVRDGCTKIPRAADGAQEDETILVGGFLGHGIAVRPPGSARTNQVLEDLGIRLASFVRRISSRLPR